MCTRVWVYLITLDQHAFCAVTPMYRGRPPQHSKHGLDQMVTLVMPCISSAIRCLTDHSWAQAQHVQVERRAIDEA
jgi:hypothetical protein